MTAADKVLPRAELASVLAGLRRGGAKVVFTNGCFDLLHAGHVRYLAQARGLGDLLVVGLNSDRSVRASKGPLRPILPEDERAEILASLAAVDYVTLFDEDTPASLIGELRPDVLVKGSDWAGNVVGADAVESWGGKVLLMPLVKGRATTRIIETVVERYGAGAGPEPVR